MACRIKPGHDEIQHTTLCYPGCMRAPSAHPPSPTAAKRNCTMPSHTIGIIVNGATGRIGSTQHLANALIPIIAQRGLALGSDRLVPRLLLTGRDGGRLAAVARTH